jgi:hypothetical protein
VLLGSNNFCDLIRNALYTHFRKLVVCRDLGRLDQMSFFSLELLLDAAIEEECDMRILFGLYVRIRKKSFVNGKKEN